MDTWIFLLLVMNLLCAVAFGLIQIRKGQMFWMILFFVFLPVLGFIIYYIPQLLQRIFRMGKYDRDSLVNRLSIEGAIKHPSVASELNIVPVIDVMTVGKNTEKRTLLLDQLRKNLYGNYKEVLAAENDEDSESAHYIAAAKMEVYRSKQGEMSSLIKAYENNKQSEEAYHLMMSALEEFIESGLLSEREKVIYRRKYCSFVDLQVNDKQDSLFQTELETYLCYLADIESYEKVVNVWESMDIHSEKVYMEMLQLFYDKRDEAKFNECFQRLQSDSKVQLSAQGLEKVRFWLERGK